MDNGRATVMLVDDSVVSLRIAKNALMEYCEVFTVPSAAKMFDLLERNKPHLILLDVSMPEMDGFAAIRILKAKPETCDIPVIFLTNVSDPASELKGLSQGAVDYIRKPFTPCLLLKRVELHLTVNAQRIRLQEQTEQLEAQGEDLRQFNKNLQSMVAEKTGKIFQLQSSILSIVSDLVESRDNATGGHVARTQRSLKALIDKLRELGLYQEEMREWNIEMILPSAQLHDVGKIAIVDSILNKMGPLTADEFEEMKKHVELGVKIIERVEAETSDNDFLKYAKIFAGTHHEKWDGSGYPNGLAGKDIPLLGRLMAIVDVYDALTFLRPYKEALPHEEAVRIILQGRGNHFDPVLVDVFAQVAGQFDLYSSKSQHVAGETRE